MKTIAIAVLSISIYICSIAATAQTPQTPKTPNVQVSQHSDTSKTTTSTSYNTSVSTDGVEDQNQNVSVSVSNTNHSYSFRARYSGAKDQELKELIIKEMGTNNLTTSNGKLKWSLTSGNEDVYEIELRKGKLTMEVDKNSASPSLVEKIVNLGKSAKTIITGKSEANIEAEKLQREADRLKREADRMQREADRMKREEERLQREADRLNRSHTSVYEKDAERFTQEAKKLTSEAAQLTEEARHRGGVSSNIKNLLNEDRTRLEVRSSSKETWVWPTVQKELITSLLSDKLITSEATVHLTRDASGMYINGEKLKETNERKYSALFLKYGIAKNNYFSFDKSQNHIVIINEPIRLDELVNELKTVGFIRSVNDKVSIELNGYTMIKNGASLTPEKVSKYNALFLKHNIIAAPGKIIEFMGNGGYKIGYSLGPKSHIGTWVFPN